MVNWLELLFRGRIDGKVRSRRKSSGHGIITQSSVRTPLQDLRSPVIPRPSFAALALTCIFTGTSSDAQVADHWRFESFSGPNAPDAGPNALDGIHNGIGSIGKEVAVDASSVIPFEDCDRNGIDDVCDLESGTSVDSDRDRDGISDECGIPGIFDVPGDFDSIAGTTSVVASGSEIVVGPGTYTDRVDNFGKDPVIRSSDGPETTIIDLTYSNRTAFWIEGSEGGSTIIEGFTIRR